MGDWKRVVLAVLCCLERVLLAGPPVFGLAEWAVKGENTAGVSGVDLYPNKGGSWKSSNFFQYLKFEKGAVLFQSDLLSILAFSKNSAAIYSYS